MNEWPKPMIRPVSQYCIAVGYWLLFSLCAHQVWAQGVNNQQHTFRQLSATVDSLVYKARYSEAFELVKSHYADGDLTEQEQFEYDILLGDVHRSSGEEPTAVKYYRMAQEYLLSQDVNHPMLPALKLKMAECYFNREHFDYAEKYALEAIDNGGIAHLRPVQRGISYLILGYCDYLSRKYNEALEFYLLAEAAYISAGQHCELPLVHTRMATIYHAMSDRTAMQHMMDESLRRIDSCDVNAYMSIYYGAQVEMLRKDGQFKEALEVQQSVNKYNTQQYSEQHSAKMREIEREYKSKLSDAEAQRLNEINDKNREVLAKQRLALYISLIGFLLLAILFILLIRVLRQREKAKKAVESLNAELESKVAHRTLALEKAYNTMVKDAELMKMKNAQMLDFCNILSHNFRGPLANMSSLLHMINSGEFDDQKETLYAGFVPVVDNLNLTCNELLESLQVMQHTDLVIAEVSLLSAFEKVLPSLKIDAAFDEAHVSSNFDEAPSVRCNPQYLESILHNFLSNALKYRHPDRAPEIHLRSRKNDAGVLLSVSDNGLGIDLDKYGKQLFRMHKVFHKHPDAKGFGLYLTKVHVEAMGGKIWAESSPGEGSTFFVQFPA